MTIEGARHTPKRSGSSQHEPIFFFLQRIHCFYIFNFLKKKKRRKKEKEKSTPTIRISSFFPLSHYYYYYLSDFDVNNQNRKKEKKNIRTIERCKERKKFAIFGHK
jgi:hypothetical protein